MKYPKSTRLFLKMSYSTDYVGAMHALAGLVSSADNLCKQFGPRSIRPDISGSKLFHTLMVFMKEFSEKVDNEKISADMKTCKITQ